MDRSRRLSPMSRSYDAFPRLLATMTPSRTPQSNAGHSPRTTKILMDCPFFSRRSYPLRSCSPTHRDPLINMLLFV